jgi:hypothetical protein
MDYNFTKKAVLFSFFGLAVTTMSAQQIKKVGGNPYLIESSAVFEIESSDKGFLMPRMTTLQRDAIAIPAEGLQVFDTDTKTIWNYDGAGWIDLLTNLTGVVTSDGNATSFGTFTSLALSDAIDDETGTGSLVLATSPTFTGTVAGIDKTMVGLANVDNTTDALKPISTATQDALDLKGSSAAVDLKADIASPTFTGIVAGIDKTMVGLANVDNTSDLNKAISTATQSAVDLKADIASPTFTGTVAGIDKTMVGLANVDNTTDALKPISTATQDALDLKGSNAAVDLKADIASPTFTGIVAGIDKTMVGLANVDNTSDLNKAISTATQTAVDLKADIASPTFTGTVGGITKAMVGLTNVDNISDINKPISTATQDALDLKGSASDLALKANIASPTFTGTVGGITKAMVGLANVDNTTDALKPISTSTQDALDLKATILSPTLVTPVLGVATATSVNKLTLTEPANGATLSLADGSTFVTAGGFSQTFRATADSDITLPTAGTLATTADVATANATNADLTGMVTSSGNATTVVTNADLTGMVTSSGNATTVVTNANISGVITSNGSNVTSFGTFASSVLEGAVSDETGAGVLVLANTPTLITPVLGAATATSVNKLTVTAPANGATLSLADNSSFITAGAFSQTLTATADTDVTLPVTGTLATLDDVAIASSKTAITAAAKTAAYTALVTDYTIVVNANGGGFELTLPAATDNTGKVYVISKRDDGVNSVSFSANPLIMADGTTVAAMNYATTIRVQSNGTNWLIIN